MDSDPDAPAIDNCKNDGIGGRTTNDRCCTWSLTNADSHSLLVAQPPPGPMATQRGVSRRASPFEPLEDRILLRSDVVISELVANNQSGLFDFFDNDSDWFEIHNRESSHVNLEGWHVTDDLANLTKWQVPVTTILAPDERRVVFVSEHNLVTVTGDWLGHRHRTNDGLIACDHITRKAS